MDKLSQLSTGLLTESEVSTLLRVPASTLRFWRWARRGPQYRKLGHLVRYPLEDVESWLTTRPQGGEVVSKAGIPVHTASGGSANGSAGEVWAPATSAPKLVARLAKLGASAAGRESRRSERDRGHPVDQPAGLQK